MRIIRARYAECAHRAIQHRATLGPGYRNGLAGVEPLPDDEAPELARKFHDLLAPAFEVEFRRH